MNGVRTGALVVITCLFVSCYSWDQAVTACYERGNCLRDGGAEDAAVDYDLALWPVPPEAPTNYQFDELTVLDRNTLLVWQKAQGGLASWAQATRQCEGLNTLGFGGVTTAWRLPTAIELLSLIDSSRTSPAINSASFPGTESVGFWSSSVDDLDGGTAWEVGFARGDARLVSVTEQAQVRCVTSKEPTPPRPRYRTDESAGVVLDLVTGLTWERSVTAEVSRAFAQAHCDSLDAGWRLPAKKELESIVRRHGPGSMIDPSAFASSVEGFFWSATPASGTTLTSTWGVDFTDDRTTFTPDVFLRSARCVH